MTAVTVDPSPSSGPETTIVGLQKTSSFMGAVRYTTEVSMSVVKGVPMDTNGDGVADSTGCDTNGDGRVNTV